MQFKLIKNQGIVFLSFCFSILIVYRNELFLQFNVLLNLTQIPIIHKTLHLAGVQTNIHAQGKTGAIVSSKANFEWIDQSKGLGKIKVEIIGESFSDTLLNFQWILPSGSSSRDFLTGEIKSPKVDENRVLELSVDHLSPETSQNIILLLKSVSENKLGISVVIPTIFSQTLEAKIANQYSPKLSGLFQKSIFSQGANYKVVQF